MAEELLRRWINDGLANAAEVEVVLIVLPLPDLAELNVVPAVGICDFIS